MNKIKKVILLSILFLAIIIVSNKVEAMSANISANKTNVNVGETVTINVNIQAAAWEVHIKGAVSADYAETSDNGEVTKVTKQLKFTPTKEGSYTINLTGNISEPNGSNINKQQISGTVTIIAKNNISGGIDNNNPNTNTNTNTKSSVATLANLGIKPNDFSGFTPSKKSYAVTVPNNVESIEVYASKGQTGQTISGTGTKSLKEGANTFTITVTAEDKKTTNQYTITVTREAKEEEKPEEPEEQEEPNTEKPTEEKFGLSTLIMSGVSLDPNFSTDVFEYKVKLTEDKDKLDIKTVSTDEKAKIEVTGNENLQEGENIITILVTDESGEKTATYQIIVEKNLVDQEELAKQKEQEEKDKQMKMILIGGAGALLVIIAIIIIIMIKRKRNRQYAEEFSIPYAGLNQEEEEEKEDRITEEDSQIKSFDPMETEDKEKLRQEFLNQSFTEFEEEKPRKNRHSKGKRFK